MIVQTAWAEIMVRLIINNGGGTSQCALMVCRATCVEDDVDSMVSGKSIRLSFRKDDSAMLKTHRQDALAEHMASRVFVYTPTCCGDHFCSGREELGTRGNGKMAL